jgi:hypothetical protein
MSERNFKERVLDSIVILLGIWTVVRMIWNL